jgi:hypothetical protein
MHERCSRLDHARRPQPTPAIGARQKPGPPSIGRGVAIPLTVHSPAAALILPRLTRSPLLSRDTGARRQRDRADARACACHARDPIAPVRTALLSGRACRRRGRRSPNARVRNSAVGASITVAVGTRACTISAHLRSRPRDERRPAREICGAPGLTGNRRWCVPWFHEDAYSWRRSRRRPGTATAPVALLAVAVGQRCVVRGRFGRFGREPCRTAPGRRADCKLRCGVHLEAGSRSRPVV